MVKKISLIILIFSCSLFITSADLNTDIEKANFIASKGIIENYSSNPSNYRLSDTITRKETMKMIMKLSGLPINEYCDRKFWDVDNDWGCKYIETALDNSYISDNYYFRPNDNITKIETLKLVIKAKGIQRVQETDNWQNDYMETAYKAGIIDKKYYEYNNNATRGWIFYAIANSIENSNTIVNQQGTCGDGICGNIEKEKGTCQQDCQNIISTLNPSGNKLCGDGICDTIEKNDLKLCPIDCKDQNIKGTCGDGICDSIEKEKGVCSEDCKVDATTSTGNNIAINDSPFGFHPGNANNYSYIQDLGANRSREGQYFIWTWVDTKLDGNYKFTKAVAPTNPEYPSMNTKINYDSQFLNVPDNIKILANVCPFRNGGSFNNTEESQTYQKFVEKMVERYDGDSNYGCTLSAPDCYNKGDSEYPTTDVITKFKKNPIKYWQVCNQVYDTCESADCKNTYADSFATAMKITYNGVKSADSSAKVLIAGDSKKDFYPAIYKKLAGKYVDIIDFHRFGENGSYNPKDDFDYLKTSLKDAGFDLSKLEFWITETSTYSGDPVPPNTNIHDSPYQSEKTQASDLIKRYISATSYGIKKVFWAWNIVEGFKKNCSIFDGAGLVYDGCDCDENNKYVCSDSIGYDLGVGVKKLSYYSYKKMTEMLNGADWNSINTIQDTNGIYIYKIKKNGKSVWILWNDNTNSQTIKLEISSVNTLKITEAIPKYVTGKEVTDYKNGFNTSTKTLINGEVSITLKDIPIFIEE